MSKKKGTLIEQYLDKIIIGVAVLAGLAIAWFFLLSSPYAVEYENRNFTGGGLDEYVAQRKIPQLEDSLSRPPEPKNYNENKTQQIVQIYQNALLEVNTDLAFIAPGIIGEIEEPDRKYIIPTVPAIESVDSAWIRSVAHYPSEIVDAAHPYNDVATELKDIDFVTVSGELDLAELMFNFRESFAGRRVRREWQDPELAQPVFASVELQRRHALPAGGWSQWKTVDTTDINHLREMYNFPRRADNLDYGVNILMVQFDEPTVRSQVLQPQPYDFAVAQLRWLPPSLYKEYADLLEKEMEQRRREQLAGRRERTDRPSRERDTGTGRGRGDRQRQPGMPGGGEDYMPGGGDRERERPSPRDRTREERTMDDVVRDFEALLLDENIRLEEVEKLLFWAHDDSIVPGRHYEYRIRIGVFNPIAGKDWVREDQAELKNQVVLWSPWANVETKIAIPEMMHFFPVNAAAEPDKTAEVEVAKFYLGKWRRHEFQVGPGEMIGAEVEIDLSGRQDRRTAAPTARPGVDTDRDEDEIELTAVNFSTGAVMVDLVDITDWTGIRLFRQRNYSTLLYSFTASGEIAEVPVSSRNWNDEMKSLYSRIKEQEDMPIELTDRSGSRSSRTGGQTPGDMPMDPTMPGF